MFLSALTVLFPNGISWLLCDVRKYGAIGDGKNDDTEPIRNAIAGCRGGGEILLRAPGKYLTGPLNLTNHTVLNIESGATLLALTEPGAYPQVAPLPSYGWSRDTNCFDASAIVNGTVTGVLRYSPVIGAFDATNVSILGGGEIDGQGQPWYDKCNAHALAAGRPRLVEFNNCTNVLIEDLTLRDSPFWTVHPIYSRGVIARRLSIFAPVNKLGNTDGINPDSCRDVLIEDCFISNGDDGVTLKAGKDAPGLRVGIPTENVIIRNITSPAGSRGGIATGSEMSGGVRNVTVANCSFLGERGIHIKSCPGRGGFVEEMHYHNITVAGGLRFTMSYAGSIPGGAVPHIANISFEGISGTGGCSFDCKDAQGGKCYNLSFLDVNVKGCIPPIAAVAPLPATTEWPIAPLS